MSKEKQPKDKKSVLLPKAWQSVKHKNDTAEFKANYDDAMKAVGTIIAVLAILFVILGGVSMTGALNFVLNWSHNIGEGISSWFEGGSIITNEDGIYWDPTGQNGTPIKDPDAPEVSDDFFDTN